MNVRFTLFLPDGTPVRAEVSVKLSLPSNLAPAALAAAARRTSATHHSGGANFLFGDGSVRFNQTDLSFLKDRASRVGFELAVGKGPGALFLDLSRTPVSQREKLLSVFRGPSVKPLITLWVMEGDASASLSPGPVGMAAGAVVSTRSASRELLSAASQYKAAGDSRQRRYAVHNAFPVKWSGPSLPARGGSDVAMEELVLSHEGITLD